MKHFIAVDPDGRLHDTQPSLASTSKDFIEAFCQEMGFDTDDLLEWDIFEVVSKLEIKTSKVKVTEKRFK